MSSNLSFEIVDQLCLYIELHCIQEGVFRIPGDQEEAELIVKEIDSSGTLSALNNLVDTQSATSALKLYLRSRKASLLGFNSWEEIRHLSNLEASEPQTIFSLIEKTPTEHKYVLRRILEMLVYITDHQSKTKMTANNLGMVFAPLLVKCTKADITEEMKMNGKNSNIWIYMIENSDSVFDLLPAKPSSTHLFGKSKIISESDVERLCSLGSLMNLSAGSVIIRSGLIASSIFFLKSGLVSIVNGQQVVHTIEPGVLVEYSLFLRSTGSVISKWSYEAATTCEIVKIDHSLFRAVLASDLALRTQFYWQSAIALSSELTSLMEGQNNPKERKRGVAVVDTPPMLWPSTHGNQTPSMLSPRTQIIKVYTQLSADKNTFKLLSCNYNDTVGSFLETCITEFNFPRNCNETHDLYSVVVRVDGSTQKAPVPLQKSQYVRYCVKSSPHGVPCLYFGQSKEQSAKDKLYELLNAKTALFSAKCKYKGSSGTLYITVEHLIIKPRNEKKKKTKIVFLIGEIAELGVVKDREIVFTAQSVKGLQSISFKSPAHLCEIFRFLVIITKPSGFGIAHHQANMDIDSFVHEFGVRHISKPAVLYSTIIKEFRDILARKLTEHPHWSCGSFKDIHTLRENILHCLLERLYPLLQTSEESQEKDNKLRQHREKYKNILSVSHFFPQLDNQDIEWINDKMQAAVHKFDGMESIILPQKKLQKILDATQILYEIVLKYECIGPEKITILYLLTMIPSTANIHKHIEYIREYLEPNIIEGSAGYFVSQLESSIDILNSEAYQELIEGCSSSQIQLAISSSSASMMKSLASFSDLMSISEMEEYSIEDCTSTSTDGVTVQSSNVHFPRAVVTAPCYPVSTLDLAVYTGQTVEITSGTSLAKNPVALKRDGDYCASYGGSTGWIPERNCRVLIEPPHNQRFVKQGYASFVDFPTTNDWFLLKGCARELREERGTVIIDKGNRFQRFFLILEGELCVSSRNCKFNLGAYETFGAPPMLLGSLSVCTVTVKSSHATILQFDPIALKKLFAELPHLAPNFFKYLSCDLNEQILLFRSSLK